MSVGNSKKIKLGKALLDKNNNIVSVEVCVEKGCFVLKQTSTPRNGWDKVFKKMHENGDDKLLIKDVFEDENLIL